MLLILDLSYLGPNIGAADRVDLSYLGPNTGASDSGPELFGTQYRCF